MITRYTSLVVILKHHLKQHAHFQMKEVSHDNLNVFVGACYGEKEVSLLDNYCSKGSLQDILLDYDIKLDWMFKQTLINDLTTVSIFYGPTRIDCRNILNRLFFR